MGGLSKNHCMARTENAMRFFDKAKVKHGDRYDYSESVYINSNTKVKIICKLHGSFLQTTHHHTNGSGCPACASARSAELRRKDHSSFIEAARKVHGTKYDYSKVLYTRNSSDVIIICPIHGEFKQMPSVHITGSGCNACGCAVTRSKLHKTPDDFVRDANKKWGHKYRYIKEDYVNSDSMMTVTCPHHGKFIMKAYKHLGGQACKLCGQAKSISPGSFLYVLFDKEHGLIKVGISKSPKDRRSCINRIHGTKFEVVSKEKIFDPLLLVLAEYNAIRLLKTFGPDPTMYFEGKTESISGDVKTIGAFYDELQMMFKNKSLFNKRR